MIRIAGILFLLIFGSLLSASATHIIGGEMYYECLGNNQYKITLKVYRDCFNGQAPFDDPANITIWDGNGNFVQNVSIPFPGSTNVPFIAGNPCFQAPPNVCVEEAIYTKVVTLPPSATGYTLAYQRCCRNNTIVNLVDPQSTGATYTETIPPSGPNACNNSPRYVNFPPIALCIGDDLNFDHSAVDPDGDSLVYDLCATYAGGSPAVPQPVPTSAPPFDQIIFQNPYSIFNPIASAPPISINPQTGLLSVSPTQLGQYVVGVCVKEYRNGVLIGTHRRDFQFNVVNCTVTADAEILLPQSFNPLAENFYLNCGELVVDFANIGNSTIGISEYLWDFGVGAQSTDTSSLAAPTFAYPDTGIYAVSLIINPGFFCSDTDVVTIYIRPDLNLDFTTSPPQCIDGNIFNYNASGNFTNTTILNWDFGPAANIPNSSQQQNNISYNSPGIHTTTLVANDLFCSDSITKTVLVYGHPEVIPSVPGMGCDPFTGYFSAFVDSAYNNMLFIWEFGNGQTANTPNAFAQYGQGNYSINFQAISTTGCQDTFLFSWPNYLTVFPSPQAGFSVDPQEQSIFFPRFYFFDESSDGISCMLYFDNGDSSDQCTLPYEYADTGHYQVMQIVTNEFGCPDTAYQLVIVKPEFTFYIPNTFTVNEDGLNEEFSGVGIGIGEYNFRIYDRWGQVIFETENQQEKWNGKYKNTGNKIPPGIYVYAVDLVDVFGEEHRYRGKVLLKRDGGKN
jgi:gliding motility-associated-like protein